MSSFTILISSFRHPRRPQTPFRRLNTVRSQFFKCGALEINYVANGEGAAAEREIKRMSATGTRELSEGDGSMSPPPSISLTPQRST